MGFKLKAPKVVKKVAKAAVKVYTAPMVGAATLGVSAVKGDSKGALSGYSMMAVGSSPSGYIEGALGTNYTGAGGLAAGDVSKENVTKYALSGIAAGAGGYSQSASTGLTAYTAGNQLSSGNLAGAFSTVGGSGYLEGLVPENLKGLRGDVNPFLGALRKPGSATGIDPAAMSYSPSEIAGGGQSPVPMLIFGAGLGLLLLLKLKRK